MADPRELEDAIRRHKLRATPARVAMLRVMWTTNVPLSHDELLARLGDDGRDRATLYRNLSRFTAVGLVRRVELGDRVWRYIVRGQSDPPFAGVFECSRCGKRVPLPELELRIPRNAPRAVARREIEIRIKGVCNDCS